MPGKPLARWNSETMNIIHEAYSKSEIARRYYKEYTGEELTNQEAANRWRMLRNPDVKILKKVNDQIHKEQKKMLK